MGSALRISNGGNIVRFEKIHYNLETAACLVTSKNTYYFSSEFFSITSKRIKNLLFGDGVWYTNQKVEALIKAIHSKKIKNFTAISSRIARITCNLNEQPQSTLFPLNKEPLSFSTSVASADLAVTNVLWHYRDLICRMNRSVELLSILSPMINQFHRANASISRLFSISESVPICFIATIIEEAEFRLAQDVLANISKRLFKNTSYKKYSEHFFVKAARAVIISTIFAAAHPSKVYGLLGFLIRFKTELVLAGLYERYHSLFLTVCIHLLINTLLSVQAHQGNWSEEIQFFLHFDILA